MYKLFSQQQRLQAIEAVRVAPEHYIVEVKERTRSTEQNSMLWRLLTITSQSVPWTINGHETMLTPDEWKDVFSASLNQEMRLAKGLRGGFVMLGRRTSKMSVSQLSSLIELIYSFLAEQGIEVDVPEQETA